MVKKAYLKGSRLLAQAVRGRCPRGLCPASRREESPINTVRSVSALALGALLFVTACGNAGTTGLGTKAAGSSATARETIEVAASTNVYGAIAKAIGGDKVTVSSFINSPDADPQAYQSTPADAVATSRAKLAIGNGAGYDDFFFALLKAAGGQRTVLNVADLSGLQSKVPSGQEFNEHLWFNFDVVLKLSKRIAADLTTIAPTDAAEFTANNKVFTAQVAVEQAKVDAIAAKYRGVRVAATEPLPLYLLTAAGLINATPPAFMRASEAGSDAPAAVVQQTLELMTGPAPVHALLLNKQTQTAATDRLRRVAAGAGIPEVAIYESLSEGYSTYAPWIGAQLDALSQALQKTS